MFIQLHDVKNATPTKETNIFILRVRGRRELYISRSFADHDESKYTSNDRSHAIVYFNRQSAEAAINTDFAFSPLDLYIERIPVNGEAKLDAKRADAIKRKMKNEARRARRMGK